MDINRFSCAKSVSHLNVQKKMEKEDKVDLRWPFRILALLIGFSFVFLLIYDFEGWLHSKGFIITKIGGFLFAIGMLYGGLTGKVPKWIKRLLGW